jgi:hypothetical protein
MSAPAALAAATVMENLARLTGRPPALLRSQVRLWYRATTSYDASKARAELGWQPRPSEQAVRECLGYLPTGGSAPRPPQRPHHATTGRRWVLENVDARGSITLCIDHLRVLWPDISRLPATMKFSARCGEPPCWSLRITM